MGSIMWGAVLFCLAGVEAPASQLDQAARIKALEDTVRALQTEVADLRAARAGGVSSDQVAAMVRAEIAKSGYNDVMAKMPGWLDGIRFYGDLRLRYEGLWYGERNDVQQESQQHMRIRARFGFEKKFGDEWEIGFRLASGSNDDPTSTNQSLTNDFNKKLVWIDLAYAKYSPAWLKGFTIGGGKFLNPFMSTDMVWDTNVNQEGLYETYKTKVCGSLEAFATVGQLFLKDNATGPDAELLAYQGGLRYAFAPNVTLTGAVAYYDYIQVEQAGNFGTCGARGNTVKGARLASDDFNLLDCLVELKFPVLGVPVALTGDFVQNLGDSVTGPAAGRDKGYAGFIKVGETKKVGDWSVLYKYAYVEADAVLGVFADNTSGPADRKGHKVEVAYQVHKNVVLSVAGYWTMPVDTSGMAPRQTLQADVIFKF